MPEAEANEIPPVWRLLARESSGLLSPKMMTFSNIARKDVDIVIWDKIEKEFDVMALLASGVRVLCFCLMGDFSQKIPIPKSTKTG